MLFKNNEKFKNKIYIFTITTFGFITLQNQIIEKKMVSFENYVKKSTRWEQSGICGSRRLVMGSK